MLKSTEHLGMLPQDVPNLDLAYLERYMQEKILVLNAFPRTLRSTSIGR